MHASDESSIPLADAAVVLDEAATVHVHRTVCRGAAITVRTATILNGVQICKLMSESWLKLSHCGFALEHKNAPDRNRNPATQSQISAPVLHA